MTPTLFSWVLCAVYLAGIYPVVLLVRHLGRTHPDAMTLMMHKGLGATTGSAMTYALVWPISVLLSVSMVVVASPFVLIAVSAIGLNRWSRRREKRRM